MDSPFTVFCFHNGVGSALLYGKVTGAWYLILACLSRLCPVLCLLLEMALSTTVYDGSG